MEEVPLAETPDLGQKPDQFILLLHEVLDWLAGTDPLKVQLIEMRYFGGMTAEESSAALSIPVEEVRRQVRLAQAWLHRQMTG